MATHTQSVLGAELRQIVDDHPDICPDPNSPVGPHVRAVLWRNVAPWPPLLGQALWEPEHGRWTVRAFNTARGKDSTEFIHPADEAGIPGAITQILARF